MRDDEARRRVLAHLRELGREMDEMSRAVSRSLGLNHTQLRALDHVLREGRLSPGELSHRLGLSTGSTTSLIDGLEELGHLRRLPHPSDGRRVVLQATDRARREGRQAFRPLGDRLAQVLQSCTADELVVIERFLHQLREETRTYGAEVAQRRSTAAGDPPSARAPGGTATRQRTQLPAADQGRLVRAAERDPTGDG